MATTVPPVRPRPHRRSWRPLPLLARLLPAEISHNLAIKALRWKLVPTPRPSPLAPVLKQHVWGLDFANPLALAAGFDKNAEAVPALLKQGFGGVEVGTITPLPQAGNSRPRVWRLSEHAAVINNYGLANVGLAKIEARLRAYRQQGGTGLVGVSIAANAKSTHYTADYVACVEALIPLADWVTLNVSCPNSAGLKRLHDPTQLAELLAAVAPLRDAYEAKTGRRVPLLLKTSPDWSLEEEQTAVVLARQWLDGMVVSNTTRQRPGFVRADKHARCPGGLSGRPLFELSTAQLRRLYALTEGKMPLIGTGGISSGLDAYLKIRAGASLLQLYTAYIYNGAAGVQNILAELAHLLEKDGFKSLQEAVGADHHKDEQRDAAKAQQAV